jgi:hypothetical protein
MVIEMLKQKTKEQIADEWLLPVHYLYIKILRSCLQGVA